MRTASNGDGPGRGPGLLAALIAGAVAGAVCGLIVAFADERAGSGAASPPGSEAFVRELRALSAELATLRDELERTRLADASQSSSAASALAPPSAGPDVAALSAALDRLAQQLGARPLGLVAPQIDTVKRKQLKPVYHHSDDSTVDDSEHWEAERENRRDEHLLWTSSQILDAYGRPDFVYASDKGQFVWRYQLGPANDVSFIFVDGRVCDVY